MSERKYSGNPYQTPVKLRTSTPRQTTEERTRSRQLRPQVNDDEADDERYYEQPKPHTSSVRYDRHSPYHSPRNSTQDVSNPKRTQLMTERRFDRSTLIIIVSLLIIVMVGGWWLLSTVSTWWMNWQNDLHYGNPRTFQTDQFVGQGDSPAHPDHFIAVNVHGRVIVVQLNMQHPELDQTYGITTTDPTTPVSLTFRPTGNTWAMYVLIGTTAPYTVELVSNGKQFVSPH